MEFHPLADIFPMMSAEELIALKNDIAEHGLREPITLAEGKIADGRNRYNACIELGIESCYEDWNGVGSLLAFIISKNLHRRHLNESQRAMVAAKIANMPAHRPKTSPIGELTSQQESANLLNVGKRSVERARKVLSEGTPELARAVEQGKVAVSLAAKVAGWEDEKQEKFVDRVKEGIVPNQAKKQINQEEKRARAAEIGKTVILPDRLTLIHGPFQTALQLDKASVDLVFTDPPYGEEYLKLWEDLASFAKRILKPNGFLLTYSGQRFLPQVMKILEEKLDYYWLSCILHTHGQLRFWGRHVWNSFKPLLIFSNGPTQSAWFYDVIRVGKADAKEYHEWAQPLAEAQVLISPFCPRGGIVVDPMAGSGTIPIAAVLEGYIGIGCEINQENYNISRARAKEIWNAQRT